jgi:hypothetical protein
MGWLATLADEALKGFCASGNPSRGGFLVQKCFLRANAKIVTFGFADKSKSATLFGGTRKQYVNLTSSDLLTVDSVLQSANQLGWTPPIAVKVTPAQSIPVRLRLAREEVRGNFPAGSEALSTRESKLDHLTWVSAEQSFSTDEKGELLLEPGLKVATAAGYKYRVEAALPGQSFAKSSNEVEILRRFYIQPAVRYGSGRAAGLSAINSAITEFGKYQIEVERSLAIVGDEIGVTEESSLPESVIDIGKNALSVNANTKKKKPHSIAIIIGEFVSDNIDKEEFELELQRTATTPYPTSITIPLVQGSKAFYVVPLSDGSQVVEASVSAGLFSSVDLPAGAVTGINSFSSTVTVNLAHALTTLGNESDLTVTLKLKVISGWAVGWAYTSHPVVYLNMRDPNTNGVLSATRALALVVHEIGHKLHLASDGSGNLPDKQAHHYPSFNEAGVSHTGPHCSMGVPSGTDPWKPAAHTASTCTMWGALKGITAYCKECQTSLRKVDLSDGF